MRIHPPRTCVGLVMMLCLVCAGCGGGQPQLPGRASVSGTVTFNGQPLKGGSIRFISKDDATLTKIVMIRPDGTYSTDRAPIGPNVVSIETESLQFGNAAAYVKIPARYADANTSDLTVELEPGENTDVNFTLEE